MNGESWTGNLAIVDQAQHSDACQMFNVIAMKLYSMYRSILSPSSKIPIDGAKQIEFALLPDDVIVRAVVRF